MIFRRAAKSSAGDVRPPRRGDAQDFLFSVPTICDEIPPALLSASDVESDVYQLHEDDWRQVEFVSIAQMSTVELNLVEIRKVRQQQVGAGFPSVHVRPEPRHPLAGVELTRREFAASVGPVVKDYVGAGFCGHDTWIAGSFAVQITDEVTAYGLEHGGELQVVGFAGVKQDAVKRLLAKVTPLLHSHGLILVAWQTAVVYPQRPGALSRNRD